MDRIFVEKKKQYSDAEIIKNDIRNLLGIQIAGLRKLIRYDIEGLNAEELKKAVNSVFSEPPVDDVFAEIKAADGEKMLVVKFLDGQYDQRADSAMQCVQFLLGGKRPLVACADVYLISGADDGQFQEIKKYFINPVDSEEGSAEKPQSLRRTSPKKRKMREEIRFISLSDEELKEFYDKYGFAMSYSDLKFVQNYFKSENRNPTVTEIKVIDTYWSDHCRHTTFLTELKSIEIKSENPHIEESFKQYNKLFNELYAERSDKYPCLMDIATVAVKKLKKDGLIKDLDESEEINACSVTAEVDVNGAKEKWAIMFKNETHNHPTEIEPFGGAATCLGGAIRDPLSGRTYVYQAMRVTGSGDPRESFEDTLKGKLPQRSITKKALAGFSSYGNQIGLATGIVAEIYHDRYKAKRLETGYVIGGAKYSDIVRQRPNKGDIIVLVGGDTGRDGCGGATGSSKAHDAQSVEKLGAEVQKGNPPEERKLQRLFRNPDAAKLIIRCNDFGAGGVAVAVGELSDSLDIHLDKVGVKYEGLSATELAISESQERMAVVLKAADVLKFIGYCAAENLKAAVIAEVTDTGRMRMLFGDETVVDLKREFLNTNGVRAEADALVGGPLGGFLDTAETETADIFKEKGYIAALKKQLSALNVCSEKGMGETFDSTIGRGTVLMPFGGKNQLTPVAAMASKPPVNGFTKTVTASSFAYYPYFMEHDAYTGAIYSVMGSLSKLVATGVSLDTVKLTFQEYFMRLKDSPARWGVPLAALLGTMTAQLGLKIASIGGKDSMSGTFEDIDVPPTLISFACGFTDIDTVIHNAFDKKGKLYIYRIKRDLAGMPDFADYLENAHKINALIKDGKIIAAAVSEEGGALTAIAKSLLGNSMGAEILEDKRLFDRSYGDIILEAAEEIPYEYIGEVNESGILKVGGESMEVLNLIPDFTSPLEGVFPITAKAEGTAEAQNCTVRTDYKYGGSKVKPRVFIPVFPGTNCEYDTAKAFKAAGAETDIYVIKNLSPEQIKQSVAEMAARVKKANIIAFPGGFSGGDEPDGSGKFIAAMFKSEALKDAVEELLYVRDGLSIGICNGFQALIKLGLLPYGHIGEMEQNSPTLTFNTIRRHVSTIVNIRVGSVKSPWLSLVNTGDVYSVPVSHGEGRFAASPEHIKKLTQNGQIFSQYCTADGKVTMQSPFNPNGSYMAVEGIVSPDGRVLGKMGHTERYEQGLYQNVPGNFDMPLFKSGVEYFK